MQKSLLLLILTFGISYSASSQSIADTLQASNPFTEKKLGVSIYAGSPAIILSAAADYQVLPYLSVEFGVGLTGNYAGARVHFNRFDQKRRWAVQTGMLIGGYGGLFVENPDLFYPFGFGYVRKDGLYFSGEILLKNLGRKLRTHPNIWPGFKIGYRIKL